MASVPRWRPAIRRSLASLHSRPYAPDHYAPTPMRRPNKGARLCAPKGGMGGVADGEAELPLPASYRCHLNGFRTINAAGNRGPGRRLGAVVCRETKSNGISAHRHVQSPRHRQAPTRDTRAVRCCSGCGIWAPIQRAGVALISPKTPTIRHAVGLEQHYAAPNQGSHRVQEPL